MQTPQVVSALKRASASTGAGFDFLMKMAVRESSLDPTAKAGTSSAAGLFQFIEQTWLGAVKQYGDRSRPRRFFRRYYSAMHQGSICQLKNAARQE